MPNPIPTLIVDGAFQSCETEVDTRGRTVFSLDHPTLLGDLTLDWGREDQWTQPDPTVLSFQLWEPWPGTWLQKIKERRAMRRGVLLVYRHEGDNPGDRILFQGFTTNVDVTQSVQNTTAGPTMGWLVRIQASDRAGFLGQINWGNSPALPEERMDQRAEKIKNQAASLGIRQMYFEPRFRAGTVKSVEVKDKSVLDMMNELYESFADQWCYNPARNTVNRIPTGSTWQPYALKLGKTSADGRIRLYPPAWADPAGGEDPIDKQTYPPAFIGACQVQGEVALASSTVQDITHISCKWWDKPSGGHDWTTNVTVRNESPPARLEFSSWFVDGQYIDPIIEDVRKMVVGDGARPMHPQVRWDTSKTGDVPDWATFESLTLPAQTVRMMVLAGSPFTNATGHPPVWHPAGGLIRYSAGRWDFTVNLSPTSMTLPAGHTPITANNIDKRITLDDPNGWRFDHSISANDLYYVGDPNVYPVP